jgi:hypothetical protein
MPYRETDDCAKEAPDAARTAKATRLFFMKKLLGLKNAPN